MTYDMKNALHRISLASQNSMSSKDECGHIAREALAAEEARTEKSRLDDYNEDRERLRRQTAALEAIAATLIRLTTKEKT
jgi:hypothetical protein